MLYTVRAQQTLNPPVQYCPFQPPCQHRRADPLAAHTPAGVQSQLFSGRHSRLCFQHFPRVRPNPHGNAR